MILDYIGCSYDEFPESVAMSEGINIIPMIIEEPSLRVLCDEVYRIIDNKELHLQVILPTQDKKETRRFPLVVYVQGSGWGKQCRGKELAQLCRFAMRGYVVAIVEYRGSEWANFPAQIIDTKYAIDYMITNAEKYFVDAEKIILWGDSSGGHCVLMAALTKGVKRFLEPELTEHFIHAVVAYYPAIDLTVMNEEPSALNHFAPDSPEGRLLGNVAVDYVSGAELNVTNYVDAKKQIPKILLISGSKDRVVPFGQTVRMYDKLKACGRDVACYQIKGAGHGGAPFWTKEVLDIVEEFVKGAISS